MPLIEVQLEAPLRLDGESLIVELDGGRRVRATIRDGLSIVECPARPLCVRLEGIGPEVASPPLPAPGGRATVTLGDLIERGVEAPAAPGALQVAVLWRNTCHEERTPERGTAEPKRFGAWEHYTCAEFVGLAEARPGAPRLEHAGIRAQFDAETPLPLGPHRLLFGQLIALAGDFYAHADAEALAALPGAWPALKGVAAWLSGEDYRETTLASDDPANVRDLIQVVESDRDRDRSALQEALRQGGRLVSADFPLRRYLALASQNHCHFACLGEGEASNPALEVYSAYHARALAAASAARAAPDTERALLAALALDAFGCHFLTDLFAAGHIRVPRRWLARRYGVLRGSLHMSKKMHDEDNVRGLWCRRRVDEPGAPRTVWRAYGDGHLFDSAAAHHRLVVAEAVRRSAAEVFARYCGVSDPAPPARSDALIPVPLSPGERPSLVSDRTLGGDPYAFPPNHWPLYRVRDDGLDIRRGDGTAELYTRADVPAEGFTAPSGA